MGAHFIKYFEYLTYDLNMVCLVRNWNIPEFYLSIIKKDKNNNISLKSTNRYETPEILTGIMTFLALSSDNFFYPK